MKRGSSMSNRECLFVMIALVLMSERTMLLAQNAASTSTQGQSSGLEEIVVTAQRYEQNLQKSSLAIDVLSGQQIAQTGVTSPEGLSEVAPTIEVGTFGPAVQTY